MQQKPIAGTEKNQLIARGGWKVVALAFLALHAGIAQGEQSSTQHCKAFYEEPLDNIYEFEPSPRILEAVRQIVEHSGLTPQRFDVKAANVENAVAAMCGSDRKIFYSASFFSQLRDSSPASWAELSILAHEVGHHLQGHTVSDGKDREKMELEADDFAGGVICKLGGTLRNALSAVERFGRNPQPGYPPLTVRSEAVAVGWTKALENGYCPQEARNAPPTERLTELEGQLLINSENAAEWAGREVLMAGWIHFEKVQFEVAQPMILLAERITFDTASSIHGPALHLIAKEIEGGEVSADGRSGEDGGEIVLAAVTVSGTTLSARGGDGAVGEPGQAGRPGDRGSNGTSGKCGAGMLGKFRGSTAGRVGKNGRPGGNGEPGGDGGDGGQLVLLTFRQDSLLTDAGGGEGGLGGRGGQGGEGGPGGRGGSGCSGVGGSQPTRPDGADGRRGLDGEDGPPGQRGNPGRVWRQPLDGIGELRELVAQGTADGGDLNALVETLKQMAVSQ